MRRLRLTTAGESHGPGLTALLSGLPAGLAIDPDFIARELARRQHGYGRGGRMKIEHDTAELVGGVRGGRTLGGPVAIWIANRDHASWETVMSPEATRLDAGAVAKRRLKTPRPGHADLAGGLKHLPSDLRDVLERASARETAARVAAGALAKLFLRQLGIEIRSGVRSLGPIGADLPVPTWEELGAVDESSPLRAIHRPLEPEMVALVDQARRAGDTLGGAVTAIAHGVPPGLGSYTAWDEKLDGRIGQAVLSIHAVKAVEIGAGITASRGFGSDAHDAIHRDEHGHWTRPTNRAGGLEGGVTNGEDVVVTAYKKPIATLVQGLPSVDLDTLEPVTSQYERSDITAIAAAGVILEAMLALVLADACVEKYGGDSMPELLAHFEATRHLQASWPERSPSGQQD